MAMGLSCWPGKALAEAISSQVLISFQTNGPRKLRAWICVSKLAHFQRCLQDKRLFLSFDFQFFTQQLRQLKLSSLPVEGQWKEEKKRERGKEIDREREEQKG